MKISDKMRRWLLYSVAGSCLPIVGNVIGPSSVGNPFPGFEPITSHGDLYIVGAALCGAALGELFGVPEAKKEIKEYAGFAGVVSFFGCVFLYAYAATNLAGLKTTTAVWVQGTTFVISVMSSIICIAASEAR